MYRRSRKLGVIALILWLLGTAAASGQAPPYAGLSLEQALLALQAQGLQVVFTNQVVRPEMRVAREPSAADPRRILDEILEPHGLEARESVGGRVIVVPASRPVAEEPSGIRGVVRDWKSGRPLSGVRVVLLETDYSAVTAKDGTFRIDCVAGSYTLEARRSEVEVARRKARVAPGKVADVAFDVLTIPVALAEIDVTANPPWILGDELSALELERDELLALPHFGGDVFHSLTLLPGATANDLSAEISLRGGRNDEVMVRLDGLEILEPYHLKDFNNAFSIMAPATLGGVTLHTGGFPVEHGGRMSGILDLTTVDPTWRRHTELGLTLLNAHAASSGTFKDGSRQWLASLRGGSLEIPFRLADEKENPRFWDAYGKLDGQLGSGQSWRASWLYSEDRLSFSEEKDEELQDFATRYRNAYAWINHQKLLGSDLLAQSKVSSSYLGRNRVGIEEKGDSVLDLTDRRRLEVFGVSQDWSWRVGQRHALKWGLDVRLLDARYEYTSGWDLEDPLAAIRHLGRSGAIGFEQDFSGQQYGAYFADRLRLGRLTLEAGARFDRNTVIDDDERWSPRLSLVYAAGEHSRWRLAWGDYYQSQRLYELQVEDGVTTFAEPELAEHRILGFERTFGDGAKRPLTLRAELYERRVSNPRVRFENLYDPVAIVPELERDRVRIAPESALARGLEVLVGGGAGPRFNWFASYSYATVDDRLDGRDVPRGIDQTHTLNVDVNYLSRRHWTLNAALRYRTGWPTTAISGGLDGEGEVVLVLGPLHGERVPDYLRLDLRASRSWRLTRGQLELYVEVQNLTNSDNVRGFDVEIEEGDDGVVEVETQEKTWGPPLPSIGLTWRF